MTFAKAAPLLFALACERHSAPYRVFLENKSPEDWLQELQAVEDTSRRWLAASPKDELLLPLTTTRSPHTVTDVEFAGDRVYALATAQPDEWSSEGEVGVLVSATLSSSNHFKPVRFVSEQVSWLISQRSRIAGRLRSRLVLAASVPDARPRLRSHPPRRLDALHQLDCAEAEPRLSACRLPPTGQWHQRSARPRDADGSVRRDRIRPVHEQRAGSWRLRHSPDPLARRRRRALVRLNARPAWSARSRLHHRVRDAVGSTPLTSAAKRSSGIGAMGASSAASPSRRHSARCQISASRPSPASSQCSLRATELAKRRRGIKSVRRPRAPRTRYRPAASICRTFVRPVRSRPRSASSISSATSVSMSSWQRLSAPTRIAFWRAAASSRPIASFGLLSARKRRSPVMQISTRLVSRSSVDLSRQRSRLQKTAEDQVSILDPIVLALAKLPDLVLTTLIDPSQQLSLRAIHGFRAIFSTRPASRSGLLARRQSYAGFDRSRHYLLETSCACAGYCAEAPAPI